LDACQRLDKRITAVDDLLTGHAPGIQDERHMDIGRALPYDTDTLGR
jgi:hypothetical protein